MAPSASAVAERVSTAASTVIEFVRPILGFDEHRRFTLVRLDDDGVLCTLESLDAPGLRFLVASPVTFFPDYAPQVGRGVVADLGVTDESADGSGLVVLLLLKAGATLATTTANLAAPLILDPTTGRALQVVVDDAATSVAVPLLSGTAADVAAVAR